MLGAERGDRASAARRNLLVLAAGMAALYGMVELVFGVATLTFEETGGSESLAGLAPAIFLACAGLAAFPAGRAMDRSGGRAVLAAGFLAGLTGCLLAGFGVSAASLPLALTGFALTGVAVGTVLLSRAAAAEMFPPSERPRAIARVLFGAVFGALLGPLVFGPLLADGEGTLDLAWFGGAGFMAAGLLVIWRLDPDPRELARQLGEADETVAIDPGRRPILQIATSTGVPSVLLALLASWAGMLTAMSLTGAALIDHGHEHGAVFPVLAAHFVGMFAFFPLVGRLIERYGRAAAMSGGLLLMAASGVGLAATIGSVHSAALLLLGVGVGWNLSFVAATAELSERARPAERATLIGFADLLGDVTGAALVIAGGAALDAYGQVAIAVGAAALPVLATLWIAFRAGLPEPAAG